jgi:hypothetical protein
MVENVAGWATRRRALAPQGGTRRSIDLRGPRIGMSGRPRGCSEGDLDAPDRPVRCSLRDQRPGPADRSERRFADGSPWCQTGGEAVRCPGAPTVLVGRLSSVVQACASLRRPARHDVQRGSATLRRAAVAASQRRRHRHPGSAGVTRSRRQTPQRMPVAAVHLKAVRFCTQSRLISECDSVLGAYSQQFHSIRFLAWR